jgi:hypothetical protein
MSNPNDSIALKERAAAAQGATGKEGDAKSVSRNASAAEGSAPLRKVGTVRRSAGVKALAEARMRFQSTEPAASERSIRADFLRRMRALSRDLARSAPPGVLADALKRPSARGVITHVLSEVGPSPEELEIARLRERAMERGLALRERLREEAGGFLDTAQVAERLGVRRQSVDKRRKEGGLLALETPLGYMFPACQFTVDGAIPGLKDALGAMRGGSFWEVLAALVTPAPSLEGRTVLKALEQARGGEERRRIREVVESYANG